MLVIDTFGVMFVPVDADGIGEAKSDQLLYGVYAKRPFEGGKGGTELYALKSELAGRSFNGTSGEDRRWTLGVRQWDKLGERDMSRSTPALPISPLNPRLIKVVRLRMWIFFI